MSDDETPAKYTPDTLRGTGQTLGPSYETKPPDGHDNGGYERVRSWEYDADKGRKRHHYAAIHRLCVVAWSDPDRPLSAVLRDLWPPGDDADPNEVHHVKSYREAVGGIEVETDMPAGKMANIEGNLVVVDKSDHAIFHDHLGVCHPTGGADAGAMKTAGSD